MKAGMNRVSVYKNGDMPFVVILSSSDKKGDFYFTF